MRHVRHVRCHVLLVEVFAWHRQFRQDGISGLALAPGFLEQLADVGVAALLGGKRIER